MVVILAAVIAVPVTADSVQVKFQGKLLDHESRAGGGTLTVEITDILEDPGYILEIGDVVNITYMTGIPPGAQQDFLIDPRATAGSIVEVSCTASGGTFSLRDGNYVPTKVVTCYHEFSVAQPDESNPIKKGSNMDEEYDIVSVDKPDDSVWDVVGWGIHNYNVQLAGDPQSQQLCFVLRSPSQEIVGGLIGKTYWDWLYIDLLFVKEELRGRGYGHRLLELAEMKRENVVQRMCIWIHSVFKRQISISSMAMMFLAN